MPFLSRFCIFFVALSFHFFQGNSQTRTVTALNRKFSPQQLQEDATVMKNAIMKIHPVIGIYRPREFYEGLFDAFIRSLKDSMTEKQFRIRIKMITDELHCGHTEAISSKEYLREYDKQKFGFSPYVFLPLDNKVYMLATVNRKKDTIIKRGYEIKKINGVPVDTMLTVCKKIISTDGFNQTGKDHYVKFGFNSYYPALFGRPDTFRVEYKVADTLKILRYPVIRLKTMPSVPISPREDSTFILYRRAAIKHRFIDEEKKTMHLRIHSFSRNRYKKAYRRIFRKMKKNKTENLIVDLRYNGGGSLENAYGLLRYILDKKEVQTLTTGIKSYPDRKYVRGNVWFKLMRFGFGIIAKHTVKNDTDYFRYTIKPRKKNHFNGKIFVLINGGSFSASCLVSAYIKSTGRAVFIGEETSGAAEGCNAGITPYYKLPNTHLKIRIPVFRVIHDVSPEITGRGIMPDYPITYKIDDVVKRKDLDLEKVKELIRK
jgi:hypothetical protein